MRAVSDLSELGPLAIIAVGVLVVLLVLRRWADAAFFVAGVGVVWMVNPLLKELAGRPRPDHLPLAESVSEYSFPSGHAANTAALVGSLVMILRSRRARAVGAVVGAAALLLVGYSQLELGRHYPSDLLAGWLWAGVWIGLVAWIRSRWRARLPGSRREVGRT
ncbi:undecaprenyl-diphosphatase [Kribbella orskensis]|uniref:Undecaprenyl-diphosphatase n=1 Tax=Kribbella orskensis TaxID=2512216 RepID=A0ABY2BKP5_9ACTN|nr:MULTISPECIES: phosphatase PAP2 family protein [Kribbella]TCN38630.1 undecaprenyl-diphosphatase [Kribbella sp. VKM Ac-2500]TCO20811.1 undecaprenyl-diphosphatase [Kribbella orskensis]